MAPSNQLTTTTNNGSQSTVTDNSLQSSVAANGVSGGTPATIQPGTSSNILLSTGGIPLGQSALSTVSLGSNTSQTAAVAQPQRHRINPTLFGFSIVLFLIAITLFWFLGRDDKKTTI